MHLNLSEAIDGRGIDDGTVQHFSLEDLFENNFEKENARVIREPNFWNSETFEESFVAEMPDPAKEMVEPELKDQKDQFFSSRIASISSIAVFLERSMFTLKNAQKFILKRHFQKNFLHR